MYADEMYLMKKKEVDKMSNLKAQVRKLKNLKKPSMLYKSFIGKKAKCNKAYELGVLVDIKNVITTDWATQLDFECDAK
eukprot:2693588-Ditylum_brightwellii.AAC.1